MPSNPKPFVSNIPQMTGVSLLPLPEYPTFRSLISADEIVRVAGAHSALGAVIAQENGFQAAWASSLEISAARCLPDASLLTMTEYLAAAAHIQQACSIPVIADCDTGFGGVMNVAHMVHQYQAAGITAVCMEDKIFPKMNSFVSADHTLLPTRDFGQKIEVAKAAQTGEDFFVVARTEAMINGLGVDEALDRCRAYSDSGADAVLVHSKQSTNTQVLEFLSRWEDRCPVVIVPTTYPDWHVDDARKAGVSVVIYANQGLRATVTALTDTLASISAHGDTTAVESRIAPMTDVFRLQRVGHWQGLEG